MARGIAAELQSLASHAGAIFVGQISSVKRDGSVVEVTFRVEQPVSGATGAIWVLREWAGLWPPGQYRYTAGQRVLAFLQTASAAALSSPVHGAEGLVPVVVQGVGAPPLLDIRRIAANVVRSPGTPLPDEADGGVLLTDVLGLINSQGTPANDPLRLIALPERGAKPIDLLRRVESRYPVRLPVQPQPRVPLKMPGPLGGRVEVR